MNSRKITIDQNFHLRYTHAWLNGQVLTGIHTSHRVLSGSNARTGVIGKPVASPVAVDLLSLTSCTSTSARIPFALQFPSTARLARRRIRSPWWPTDGGSSSVRPHALSRQSPTSAAYRFCFITFYLPSARHISDQYGHVPVAFCKSYNQYMFADQPLPP